MLCGCLKKKNLINVQFTVREMQIFCPNGSKELIFGHFKQDVGLYHQFVQAMNGRFCSDKLSPWLFSNLAALTVSCFEIRKHVIHSPTLTAAIRDSGPFNTPLHLNVSTFLSTLWVWFTSPPTHHHLQQWMETNTGYLVKLHLARQLLSPCSLQMRGLCGLGRKLILNLHIFLWFAGFV